MPISSPFAEQVVSAVFAIVDSQKLTGGPGALARETLRPLMVAEVNRLDAGRVVDQPVIVAAPQGGKKATPEGATMAERIYEAYPRHVGRKAAFRAIACALMTNPGAVVLNKTRDYAAAVEKWPANERRFIPHPATWFNQGRYADDPKEWQRGSAQDDKRTYDRV